MSPTGFRGDPLKLLSDAQRNAVNWLTEHNGDGHFGGRGGTLMAAGEIAPVRRSTWNELEKIGLVEFYSLRRRIRLSPPPPHESDQPNG